jgi:hypothetical protein
MAWSFAAAPKDDLEHPLQVDFKAGSNRSVICR